MRDDTDQTTCDNSEDINNNLKKADMVQKFGKHDIQTEHTIRAFNSRHNRRYRRYCLLKMSAPRVKVNGRTLNIDHTVPYSLNKQARWELPELIVDTARAPSRFTAPEVQQQFVRHIRHHADRVEAMRKSYTQRNADIAIVLSNTCLRFMNVEQIDMRNNNLVTSCTMIYQTFSEIDQEISVLEGIQRSFSETRCRDINYTRIDVLTPSSLKTQAQVKPSHLEHHGSKNFKKHTAIVGKRKQNRQTCDVDLIEYYLSTVTAEDEAIYICLENERQHQRTTITLCDYFPQNFFDDLKRTVVRADQQTPLSPQSVLPLSAVGEAATMASIQASTANESQANSRPSTADETLASSCAPTTVHSSRRIHFKMQGARILLRKDEVLGHDLRQMYGKRYIECGCFPRRFLLDISNNFYHMYSSDKFVQNSKVTRVTHAFLAFVRDSAHALDNKMEHAYKVFLNINAPSIKNNVLVENLRLNDIMNITDVIAKSKQTVQLKYSSLLRYEEGTEPVKMASKRSFLDDVLGWQTTSYLTNNTVLMDQWTSECNYIDTWSHGSECSAPYKCEDDGQTDVHSEVCALCMKPVRKYSVKTITLKTCKHCSCVTCFTRNIRRQMRMVVTPLKCPVMECSVTVEASTVISVIDIPECLQYLVQCQRKETETNPLKTFCPNTSCQRILVRNSLSTHEVQCPCGERLCFACCGLPHWPLSCDQYTAYLTMIFRRDVATQPPAEFVVNLRSLICRVCLTEVQKFGVLEASATMCTCHREICSRCLQQTRRPLIEHADTCSLVQTRPGYVSGTRLSKWKSLAFQHRSQRHPYRIQKLKANSKLLVRKLKPYILTSGMQLGFHVDEKVFSHESHKVRDYIDSFIDMYATACRVGELTSALIDIEGQEQCKQLQKCLLQLSVLSKTVTELFKSGGYQRPDRLHVELKEARTLGNQLLNALYAGTFGR
ncbi:uncharacterized protein LOC127839418 isoform X1 [Dreissena polymorpha]|nr:uncharacterized protein LOC127839418 isoform X1 [Dreissena polymorpha]